MIDALRQQLAGLSPCGPAAAHYLGEHTSAGSLVASVYHAIVPLADKLREGLPRQFGRRLVGLHDSGFTIHDEDRVGDSVEGQLPLLPGTIDTGEETGVLNSSGNLIAQLQGKLLVFLAENASGLSLVEGNYPYRASPREKGRYQGGSDAQGSHHLRRYALVRESIFDCHRQATTDRFPHCLTTTHRNG